jgi:hypothetical protein
MVHMVFGPKCTYVRSLCMCTLVVVTFRIAIVCLPLLGMRLQLTPSPL